MIIYFQSVLSYLKMKKHAQKRPFSCLVGSFYSRLVLNKTHIVSFFFFPCWNIWKRVCRKKQQPPATATFFTPRTRQSHKVRAEFWVCHWTAGERRRQRERESETQITGHSALLSHKMQEKMAAEAGNKATTAQRHEATTQMFLSFSKSKLCYLTGKPQWAKRHLRPPGSHSKELAKTISLKSPAILIWQPDSITRRKNCFSRHQQSSGNYLNCVMIMPHSSGGELYVAPFQTHRSTSRVLWAPLHQHSGRRERMRGK